MPPHRMDVPYRGPPPGYSQRDRGYDDRHHGHGYHDGRRHSIDDSHGHHRSREHYGDSRKNAAVPFEEAMAHLHDTLDEAKAFFQNFEHSFNDDTQRILRYAEQKIIQRLWLNKIDSTNRMPRNRRRHATDNAPSYNDEPRESMDEMNGSFNQWITTLKEDFVAALQSTNRSQHSRRDRSTTGQDADSVGRLKKKLHAHWGNIEPMIGSITHAREKKDMADFLQELDQACNVLDKARNMWDSGQGPGDGEVRYGDVHGSDGGGGVDGYGDGS